MLHSTDLQPNLVGTELQRKIGAKYLPTPVLIVTPKEGYCHRMWRTKIRPNWVLIVLIIGLLVFILYRLYTTWVWKQEQLIECGPSGQKYQPDQIDDMYAREMFLHYRKNDDQIMDTVLEPYPG